MLEQLLEALGDDMHLAYRHFPLTNIHDKATLAAEASEAAGAQGLFWEYHDLLFTRQQDWTGQTVEAARDMFIAYAEELGLDTTQFAADLENNTYRVQVEAAEQAAREANLQGTPSILVNGYLFPLGNRGLPFSPLGIDRFLNIVRVAEMQFDPPPPVIDLNKSYQATVSTEKGDIVIALFANTAPTNVNSFVYLAQNGWYENITFHRVLDGFMAQAGDPSGTGIGWPGYRCPDEVTSDRTFDKPGVVAMANSGPDTNGGQFFITYGPTPHLNTDFTIIGEVISGQEVADSITRRDPNTNPDFEGDKIFTITIAENP